MTSLGNQFEDYSANGQSRFIAEYHHRHDAYGGRAPFRLTTKDITASLDLQ